MKGWYELEGLMWKDIDGILGSILGTIGSDLNLTVDILHVMESDR